MVEWISVKERMPNPFESVLVFMPGESPLPTIHEGFVDGGGLWLANHIIREPGEVTHWQPMPLPPAECLVQYIKGGANNG